MPEGSPSVLIIRLDGIGDALALTPLLLALRQRAIPADLVLRPSNAGIFSSSAVRRVIVASFALRSSARSNLATIEALGSRLRERRYTHVLVATEDPGGYRLAAAIAAPLRIGFENGWGKPLKTLWARSLLTQTVYRSAGLDSRGRHECETLFTLGTPLLGDERPTQDAAALRPLVLEREPADDERILIQLSDKWKRLSISDDAVVELGRRLAGAGPVRLVAALTESAFAERIAASLGAAVEYFDDLGSWKAAIAAAPVIVAPDSGAAHVAGMVGTPVVVVFPPTRDFALQVARWSPWAAPHRIVRADREWPARASEAVVALR